MNEKNKKPATSSEHSDGENSPLAATVRRRESRRWWIKLALQPLLLLAGGALLIIVLGLVQKLGWISAESGSGGHDHTASAESENTRYICPMMCTPPLSEPGRCPVCAMELMPLTSGGANDPRSVQIDPAARRVANIRTAAVKSVALSRTLRAVGELAYDEGSLKTISAYVDGRLERLYADFTGVAVTQGDQLALVYSPRLYSGQVELLLAKKALDASQTTSLPRVLESNRDMYKSTKQRLLELGMTHEQIQQLELSGEANSRMHLHAPISGTVIKKLAAEGQYLKEGEAIYELADLSTVWLMLELFPEDAATIRYGQKVEAKVQSLPGRKFAGRVAFVDPMVDPVKRTIGVRVVILNDEGLLKIGDYAKASIQVPLDGTAAQEKIYDPALANKWISPRHPYVVESAPGKCRVCGIDLVPASQFGFTDQPNSNREALAIPRTAVLSAGDDSVVYVETEPGKFEIRNVVLGARSGDQIVVLEGLKEGEQVAVSGNFLIDSQMQLSGNPSLIDPTKAQPTVEIEFDEGNLPPIDMPQIIEDTDSKATSGLSPEDQRLVEQQEVCPVTDLPLDSMGTPIKIIVQGRPVFLCCEGCRKSLLADPDKYLKKLAKEDTP